MRWHDVIEISAPRRHVWELTIDIACWPDFLPTVTKVQLPGTSPLGIGSTARLSQPRLPVRTWTVTRYEPETCFAWQAQIFGATMTATHELSGDDYRTVNTLILEFDGGAMRTRLIAGQAARSLRAENAALKAHAERHPH